MYAAPKSKMLLIVMIVIDSWKAWSNVTKSSILDFTAVIDAPPHLQSLRKELFKLDSNSSKSRNC